MSYCRYEEKIGEDPLLHLIRAEILSLLPSPVRVANWYFLTGAFPRLLQKPNKSCVSLFYKHLTSFKESVTSPGINKNYAYGRFGIGLQEYNECLTLEKKDTLIGYNTNDIKLFIKILGYMLID